MPTITFGSPTVSGEVQVSVETGYPEPSTGQTHKQFNGASTAGADTIFTVGAGKIIYVTDILLSQNTGGISYTLTASGDIIAKGALQVDVATRPATLHLSFRTPLKLIATETFILTGDGVDGRYTITGFEVTA